VNRQIGVGHSKNVIVFDLLLTGHVIRPMRSGRICIFSGNQPAGNVITHISRTDRHRVFKLGGKVGHVTPPCMTTVQGQKVKVTRSRDVSADKNAITRQWMVISTSNLVGIIDVGVDACGILSRSVGQTNRK